MPIVSHILEQTVAADGSTHNVVRLYDQDAREYMSSFHAPPGFDVATKISTMTTEMDEQLKQTEFESLVGAA
jgi:hypothetical protein